jgi:hypothetical protein
MKKKKRDLTLEPQIIRLNLSEDKFEQFKTELASLGRVESVSPISSLEDMSADKTRAQLRIKITILPSVE